MNNTLNFSDLSLLRMCDLNIQEESLLKIKKKISFLGLNSDVLQLLTGHSKIKKEASLSQKNLELENQFKSKLIELESLFAVYKLKKNILKSTVWVVISK